MPDADDRLVDATRRRLRPLETGRDLDPVLERVGDARYVLLGEASHGTSEYYTWRARLTERLVREKGFSFVAVEGDWPDCRRVDRYVKGAGPPGEDARDVLRAFERWPTWMWANEEVLAFVERLRAVNDARRAGERVGFYGLDVYSLWDSLAAVTRWLGEHRPDDLEAARLAYQCFEPYGEDVQAYARATALVPHDCQREVADLLAAVRRSTADGLAASTDDAFDAEQNALVAENAEAYYRAMVQGGPGSWNLRDTHMTETLRRLMAHHGPGAKAVVWEHNTHVGDARATDMADDGLVNVGQLVREAEGEEDVFVAGFGSWRGSVVAAEAWEAPMRKMPVPPARRGSWEDVLHRAHAGDALLVLDDVPAAFDERRGHRAIGVVYHPRFEAYGNYVPTVLPQRYDAFLHVDVSHAVLPLHAPGLPLHEPPETYPFGL